MASKELPTTTGRGIFPPTVAIGPRNVPKLLGGQCSECYNLSFPIGTVCTRCLSENIVSVDLPVEGKIYSFTTIHQGPPGFEVPYVAAYIDLTPDLRVMARINSPNAPIEIGMPVRLSVVRPSGSVAPATESLTFSRIS